MLVRQEDGFLAAPPDQLPISEWQPVYLAMQNKLQQEGLVDRAVSVLKRAGYHAWINPVGHVAVDPQGIAFF